MRAAQRGADWVISARGRRLIEEEIERLIALLDLIDYLIGDEDAEEDDPPEEDDTGIADPGGLSEAEGERLFAARFAFARRVRTKVKISEI